MRANLSENPIIFVRDKKRYQQVRSLAAGRRKTLLSDKEYKSSVNRAADRFKSVLAENK